MPGDASRKNGRKGGRPPGPSPSTLDKIAAREFVRQQVTASLAPMIRAQIAHAQGIGHLFARDKAGKFTKVESQDEIDRLLTEGVEGENYWIFTKDPSVQAFTDLLNRALDKPKEQMQEIQVSGSLDIVGRIREARKRLQARETDPQNP